MLGMTGAQVPEAEQAHDTGHISHFARGLFLHQAHGYQQAERFEARKKAMADRARIAKADKPRKVR